jgi:hypothetical protein
VREEAPEAQFTELLGEEVFTRARIGVSRASEAEQVPWVASSLLDLVYFVHTSADRRGGR